MNSAVVLFIQKYTGAVITLVEDPFASSANVRRDSQLLCPTVGVQTVSLRREEMTHQRPAAIAARVTTPALPGDRRHYDR
jgi:hypothetical protein